MKERNTGRRKSVNASAAKATRAWSTHVRPLSVFALFFVLCFGGFLFRGKFLIGGDVFFYLHPLRTVAFELIRGGQVPVWTPLILSGYPLLAMSSVGIAYPINWTHLFLPSHWALQIFVLVPFILAPAFTYAYARTIGLTRTAALLAGLSFTYGGLMTNTYGMNGIPGNALMWLPLMLAVIERSLSRSFIPHLVAATAIYSLSILTGHGQSFLQVGTLALVYALFLVIKSKGNFFRWERWRPFLLVIFAIVLSGGLTAFQILETLRAARQSIRATLSAQELGSGGFTFAEAIRSFAAPLFHYLEVTTYQAPLILVLAVCAVVLFRRSPHARDPRVLFWSVVAMIAFVLLLGGNTPAYQLLVHVPLLNMVRRPSRYVFEFTFAISILGAYGWDAINTYVTSRLSKRKRKENPLAFAIGVMGFGLSVVLAIGWYRAVHNAGSETTYLSWKLLFTLTTSATILWCLSKLLLNTHLATLLLICVCFVEPFILIGRWWPGTAKPASRFNTPALTTSWLQQFSPTEQRVYVRANGPEEESATQPRIDALDRTALFGLHNVGGYEPFMFERYSRALGNVEFDAVGPRAGFAATNDLFGTESHVLDLLNTGYVVTWPNLSPLPESTSIERAGVRFADTELGVEIAPGTTAKLAAASNPGDTLFLVTSLAHSTSLKDGTEVARIRVLTVDGRTIETAIRAGIETAEWAHERPDIRTSIQHRTAPIFDRPKGDETGSFNALRYLARIPIGQRAVISHIEIENESPVAQIAVWKVTIYDTASAKSHSLSKQTTVDATRWQLVKELDGVQILRNLRSLPRVWLVQHAEAIDAEEALRRISHDAGFDPRRTVLLEVNRDELPPLTSTTNSTSITARLLRYEPAHLAIATNAEVPTVLVVSENYYPGWEATLDGQHAPIMLANYLLRAVYVPSGQHQIEMRYRATGARNGAIISILTLTILIGLFIYGRRTAHARSDEQQ